MQEEIFNCKDIKPGCETDLPDDKNKLSETKFGKFHPGGYVRSNGNYKEKRIIKVGQSSSDGSQGGMVYSSKGVAMTLCAAFHGYAMGFVLRKYERTEYSRSNRQHNSTE